MNVSSLREEYFLKLYKYIGFCKSHWREPLDTGNLFFSSVSHLHQSNDPTEFRHEWSTDSYIFNKYGSSFNCDYARLFEATRILCLSENFSRHCWQSFCPKGGICYEFDYYPEKNNDLSASRVSYVDKKEFNSPAYFIDKIPETAIKRIFESQVQPSWSELNQAAEWLKSGTPNEILLAHIWKELALKKTVQFSKEVEYRFLTVVSGTHGKKTLLENDRMDFAKIGLRLRRIHITNQNRLQPSIPRAVKIKLRPS